MPSLCLLCVAMLVRALSLWVTIQQDGEESESPKPKRKSSDADLPEDQEAEVVTPKKETDDSGLRHRHSKFESEGKDESEVPGEHKEAKAMPRKVRQEASMSIVNVGANYLSVHLLGYAVMNSPTLLSHIGKFNFNIFM
jgi:hypothetical protein